MTRFFLNTIIFLALSLLFAGCEKEEMMPTTEPGEEVMCCVEFGHEEFDNVADYFDDLFSEEIDYDASENDSSK